MKRTNAMFLTLSLTFATSALAVQARSVFLNGVDISSTKNQSMQQVNISIDSQGNIYIEAPHYEAQQETTFVPLGRQGLNPARIPQHKAPGPLPSVQVPASQAELAPAGETRDTVATGAGAEGLTPKEGVRIPSDANQGNNRDGASPAAQPNPAKNPTTH